MGKEYLSKVKEYVAKFKGYVFKSRGNWLFLTMDVRNENKEDWGAYHHIIGWSLFKRPWFIRKVPLFDEGLKRNVKERVYLEVVNQKYSNLY